MQKMSTSKNSSNKKLKKPTKDRIKSVLATMLESSKLLQGSKSAKVAGVFVKVSVVLGAVYAVAEIFL